MNWNSYKASLAVIALAVFGAPYTVGQTGHQRQPGEMKASVQASKKLQGANHDMSKMDMSVMMNEPHHVLAMAYRENAATFA